MFDGMIINKTGSETHKELRDLDQLQEHFGIKGYHKLTLEADEKLTLIEGTTCDFEGRSVVGRLKMRTFNGRTFGIVF